MALAVWRDLSLMWLTFWTLIAILPIGVILFFAIKGMHRLRPATRQALRAVQSKVQQVSDISGRLSIKVAAPAIQLYAKAAQVDQLNRAILGRRRG